MTNTIYIPAEDRAADLAEALRVKELQHRRQMALCRVTTGTVALTVGLAVGYALGLRAVLCRALEGR